jgi:hypothetical protein
MIYSLRSRFLVGVVVGVTFVLCVFCIVIYTATRHTLIYHFDKSLLSTAKTLSAIIENEAYDNDGGKQEGYQDEIIIGARKIDFQFDVHATPEFNNLYGGAYYQFRDANGITIIRSPSLANADDAVRFTESNALPNQILSQGSSVQEPFFQPSRDFLGIKFRM